MAAILKLANDALVSLDARVERRTEDRAPADDKRPVEKVAVAAPGNSAQYTELLERLAQSQAREAALESQIKEAYAEMMQARSALQGQTESDELLNTLKAENNELQLRLASLQAEYEASRASHAVALSSARNECVQLSVRLESAAAEVSALRLASSKQAEELRSEVAELSAALAAATRASVATSNSSAINDTFEESRLKLEISAAVNAAIAAERQATQRVKAELDAVNKQLQAAKAEADTLRTENNSLRTEAQASDAAHKAYTASLIRQLEERAEDASKAKVALLAASVAAKTEALEVAYGECAGLKLRLAEEQRAHATTKASLQSAHDAHQQQLQALRQQQQTTIVAEDDDALAINVPVPTILPRHASSSSSNNNVVSITPLRRVGHIVQGNRQVAAAADTLDRFCLTSTKIILRQPLARLLVIVYLLLLHLWAFFVLSFHTHALPHDQHAGTPKMPGK